MLAALVVDDDATLCEQDPAFFVTHDDNAEETVLESWHSAGKEVDGYPFERDLASCCRFLQLSGRCRVYTHPWSRGVDVRHWDSRYDVESTGS